MSLSEHHHEIAWMRQRILEVAFRAGEGHVPSALSILDILWVLNKERMSDDDRLILSKGHGCLALYAVLLNRGQLSHEDFFSFGEAGSKLGGHPDRLKHPAFTCSTGSLGHGLPQAVGLALGKRIKGEPGNVYVLCGDQECVEGTTWESALLAADLKLGNLCLIVDRNHSDNRSTALGDIGAKFAAFGWTVYTARGHDPESLKCALWLPGDKPLIVIADTIKGHGVPEMEAEPNIWHHRAPTKEMAERFT